MMGFIVSVPFSMGTVLHLLDLSRSSHGPLRFSPLLDGDGVASRMSGHAAPARHGFSPLLDGDGVASHVQAKHTAQFSSFSPLLDGDGVASGAA